MFPIGTPDNEWYSWIGLKSNCPVRVARQQAADGPVPADSIIWATRYGVYRSLHDDFLLGHLSLLLEMLQGWKARSTSNARQALGHGGSWRYPLLSFPVRERAAQLRRSAPVLPPVRGCQAEG